MAGKDLVFTVNETDINFATGNFTSQKPVLNKYYPILAAEMGLSIFCSTALIFVYIIIGEHRTVPGKNVISISLCLIITYIMLTIDLLMRNNLSHALCMVVGVIVQTTFLATFFWTNVMSYDIMITMASVKSDAITTFKYWKYSVYAWTMTLLCVVPAVVVDNIDEIPNEYKPRFGVKKCWISGQLAFLIYLNAPVGVTLTANCVFFILTAKTIIKVRRSTAILATNRHKKRFRLCVKLVLIMGLVWIAEFIPWLTGIYYLYAIAGMLNCLHGVYLFLIFVCKQRILKQVITDLRCTSYGNSNNGAGKKKSQSLDTITTTVST